MTDAAEAAHSGQGVSTLQVFSCLKDAVTESQGALDVKTDVIESVLAAHCLSISSMSS